MHVDNWVGRGAYYLIMLFVLVAVFQTLGLTILTEPLNRLLTSIFEFAPRILGAGFLLIIALDPGLGPETGHSQGADCGQAGTSG